MHIRNRNGSKNCSETMDTSDNKVWTYSTTYSQDASDLSICLEKETAKKETMVKKPEVKKPKVPLKTELHSLGSEFSLRTTAHGWGRVAGAHSRTVKIIWLCVTLLALTASGIHVSLLLAHFLSFQSEVKWQVSVAKIAFPSVSICNIQPMSPTTAEDLLMDTDSNFYQWYNITESLESVQDYLEENDRLEEFETFESRLQQPIGYYENIGDEAEIVGHKSMDFILGCTFSQNKCSHGNFTLFQSAQYFNCYTFNGGDRSREELVSTMSGPHEGLSLVLYLENDNGRGMTHGTYHTSSPVGNAAGARVLVHPVNTKPSPIDHGIDVPPGFSANVGLTVTEFERLNLPYGDCTEKNTRDYDDYVYSRHACISLCQQHYVIDSCGCLSSVLPHKVDFGKNYTFCAQWLGQNHTDLATYLENIFCENQALNTYLEKGDVRKKCKCYPECDETLYNSELSLSSWPLEFSQISFFDKYVRKHPNASELKAWQNLEHYNDSELVSSGLIGRNFARVNVYLKSMTIEEYLERKSYELPNLFSDIGGTCGLWIGMSIITWCEVVELFVRVIYRAAQHAPRPFM